MASTFLTHARTRRAPVRALLAAACAAALASPTLAQQGSTVTVTGRSLLDAGVAGFPGQPLERAPLQATLLSATQLAEAGVTTLAGITRLDASLGEAYNAEGYWAILSSRGYTLDNRFNYRRDGLPINAETALPLANKERVELLKGASGIQAGSSAPGGLANLVVKRPGASLRQGRVELQDSGGNLVALDLADRAGAFAWRINASHERLDPPQRHTQGERRVLALAADAQLGADTLLQAEIERSHQRQPSVAGFSLLGNSLPSAATTDPRLNLNNQRWSQPVLFDGDTGSLRLQQRLGSDWRLTLHAMQQRLRSDDRVAFPYGVYDANYDCPQWCDRYAPDGSFSYWQFVSDNERRTTRALQASASGRVVTGALVHQLEFGILGTRYEALLQDQVFDLAGTGRVDGSVQVPPSAGYPDANTNRRERSLELFVRDTVALAADWQLWAGLRHTRLRREAWRTSPASDGLRATDLEQSLITPWLALSYRVATGTTAYASWGQGMESDVAPNRSRYVNRGQALPALKSRQTELGLKHAGAALSWQLALFDIQRPVAADIGSCSAARSCERKADGTAHHRGLEAAASWRDGAWMWQGSAMWLDARREGSAQADVNGLRPVNVPRGSLRLGAEWTAAAVAPGLALQGFLVAEGERQVLPYDSSVRVPGWARVDLAARWRTQLAGAQWTWRIALDNAFDRRAWKESPYQFGHSYLYPLAPRTWRASVQVDL